MNIAQQCHNAMKSWKIVLQYRYAYEYTYVCVGFKSRIEHSRVDQAEYSAIDCYVAMS